MRRPRLWAVLGLTLLGTLGGVAVAYIWRLGEGPLVCAALPGSTFLTPFCEESGPSVEAVAACGLAGLLLGLMLGLLVARLVMRR
jgi:hypothetical protein